MYFEGFFMYIYIYIYTYDTYKYITCELKNEDIATGSNVFFLINKKFR